MSCMKDIKLLTVSITMILQKIENKVLLLKLKTYIGIRKTEDVKSFKILWVELRRRSET